MDVCSLSLPLPPRSVYEDLVARGVIVPAQEVPPPTVPMDYSWARVGAPRVPDHVCGRGTLEFVRWPLLTSQRNMQGLGGQRQCVSPTVVWPDLETGAGNRQCPLEPSAPAKRFQATCLRQGHRYRADSLIYKIS